MTASSWDAGARRGAIDDRPASRDTGRPRRFLIDRACDYFSESPAPVAGFSVRGGRVEPVDVASSSTHSGIDFRLAVVIDSVNAPLPRSHLNWSTGMATRWPPTPRTPPEVTTSRSIFLLSGSIRTSDT